MKKRILLLTLSLLGCSDVVTSQYETYQIADDDGVFDRGWLPRVVPKDATQITVHNDLDLNSSSGRFSLSQHAIRDFEKHLKPVENIAKYQYEENGNMWLFSIHNNGTIDYELLPSFGIK